MKRYAEYKNSEIEWIGEIPSSWEMWKLKHTADLKTEKADVGGQRYVGLENVESYSGRYVETTVQEIDGLSTLFKNGDVLFGKLRPYLAKCFIPEFDGICSSEFLVLRNFKGCNGYLQYLLLSPKTIEAINASTYGAKMPRANWTYIGQMQFPLPPLSTQQCITDYLDRKIAAIDTLIADKQKLVELLREKQEATISEAVTKGLDKNAPMKGSGIEWIGEIPQEWKVSRIGFESWVRARLGWKGLKAEEYVDEGYAFLSTPNIKDNQIDFQNVNYISQERYDESPEIKINVGDVLLAKDGSTLGTVNVVRTLPREATVNSSIAIITPKERINSVYLCYLFQSDYMKSIIQMKKGGMGVPHLFQGDIVKFSIPVPPKSEQDMLSDYLDAKTSKFNFIIAVITSQIEKLKEYRQAVISEAVTGKVAI